MMNITIITITTTITIIIITPIGGGSIITITTIIITITSIITTTIDNATGSWRPLGSASLLLVF